jgi:hypothetical protein
MTRIFDVVVILLIGAFLILLTACAGPRPVTTGGMNKLAKDMVIVESSESGEARGIYE